MYLKTKLANQTTKKNERTIKNTCLSKENGKNPPTHTHTTKTELKSKKKTTSIGVKIKNTEIYPYIQWWCCVNSHVDLFSLIHSFILSHNVFLVVSFCLVSIQSSSSLLLLLLVSQFDVCVCMMFCSSSGNINKFYCYENENKMRIYSNEKILISRFFCCCCWI